LESGRLYIQKLSFCSLCHAASVGTCLFISSAINRDVNFQKKVPMWRTLTAQKAERWLLATMYVLKHSVRVGVAHEMGCGKL
jgi:hypothetical protein